MTRRTTASIALSLATVIAACAAFDSVDENAPPSPGADAGSDTQASVDAGVDATTSDASVEAGSDAHTFFDNFDELPFGAKWTNKTFGAPAVFEVTGQNIVPVSAPNALHASAPDNDGSGFYNSLLMKRFDRSVKSFKCRTLIWVEDHSETGSPSILGIDYRIPADAGFGNTGFDMNIKGGGSGTMIFQDGPGGATYPASSLGLTTKKWQELAIAIDSDAREVDVTLDGIPYIVGQFPAPVRPNVGFEVKLGSFSVGTGDASNFFFDDFWCDVVFDP